MLSQVVAVTSVVFLATACGGPSGQSEPPVSTTGSSDVDGTSTTATGDIVPPCADVVDVRVETDGDAFRFHVTVQSGDTGWAKYADAWEIRTPDGSVLGERVLLHPHETEQPFTRSLAGVVVPQGVDEVVVAARDSVNGYCGATMTVPVRR